MISLQDDVLSFYREDYLNTDYASNGEEGPLMFEVKLEQCRSFIQVAARQAYCDTRLAPNGEALFASKLAAVVLSDAQISKLGDDACKLCGLPAGTKKRFVSKALQAMADLGAADTKLTWKQLVGITNNLIKACGGTPQKLNSVAVFEEYEASLQVQEFQADHDIGKAERFVPSEFEIIQATSEAAKEKMSSKARKRLERLLERYAEAVEAVEAGEAVFEDVHTDDVFAALRLVGLGGECKSFLYNRGHSAAGSYEVEAQGTTQEMGKVDASSRSHGIDIELIERWYETVGEKSVSSDDAPDEEEVDALLAALEKDGRRGVIVPLAVSSPVGIALLLVDSARLNKTDQQKGSSRYRFVVGPLMNALITIGKGVEAARSQCRIWETYEDAEWEFNQMVADAFRPNGAAQRFLGANGHKDLPGCPAAFRKFFA